MELDRLIAALSDPSAYPGAPSRVEVHQTHISVVLVAGDFAYKIKKPVHLDFVDYSTLARRRHYCEEEVRINRRLAPSVYFGVVPVAREGSSVRLGGGGEVVEWAVKMARLPGSATLRERVGRGEVGPAELTALARRIAGFHAGAGAGPGVAASGRFEVVAANARANLEAAAGQIGDTVSRAVLDRLAALTGRELASIRGLVESRAARGVPRDGHGDLRLDHVYLFPDRPAPDDLAIVDAIEFDARYRCADPVADAAFLVMDLAAIGRWDLARAFGDAYLRESGDEEGRALLPFYVSYRAAVRGKVEGLAAREPEVSDAGRDAARARARGLWLVALGALEEPALRPCLVLVGGLPGAGKSTLARGLSERAGFATIRTDEVRKELAAIEGAPAGPSAYEAGIYSPGWTDRTYAESVRRAEALLSEGRRALIDASFRDESHRRLALGAARRWGVPALFLECRADPEVARARLDGRRGDASDADWSVHVGAAGRWEPIGPEVAPVARVVEAGRALADALDLLRAEGLAGPGARRLSRPGGPSPPGSRRP